MTYMKGIIWFREDLRLNDNTALYFASQKCTSGLIGVYIINPVMWINHEVAACRIEFILRGLQQLSADLSALNIPLLIIHQKNIADTPTDLFKLVKEHKVQAVFFNSQYEVNEMKRDSLVIDHLRANNIFSYTYNDQTILTPGSVKTQQGDNFKVFTPYKRAWHQIYNQQNGIKLLSSPKKQPFLNIESMPIPVSLPDFISKIDPLLWPAGEKAANTRLNYFIENKIFKYDKQRDFPAIDGTSKLSPYLSCGMISPRQCFMAALIANNNEINSGSIGIQTWLTELIWRDFYKNILITAPRICMHRAYQSETEKIQWHSNKKQLEDWQQGNTGYPIVDAAMRQLNTTGWMHNRLRMITAMFLSKNLFLDWRLGEQYFMRHLIDGDLSANNGGWQWSASTGTDAAPYFRIFNPVTQSERFDPDGKFIREFCPELAALDNRAIHNPHLHAPLLAAGCHYPLPIVNLSVSRQYAIDQFKSIK